MESIDQVNCEFGPTMMAYIYGELAEAERANIDEHLAGCMACTDEFAELSLSRFSVYEWKREEFDPIATPSFVVPFAPEAAAAGWFAGLRAVFGGWAPVVGFAAVTMVVVGIGLFALTGSRGPVDVVGVPPVQNTGESPAPTFVVSDPGPISVDLGRPRDSRKSVAKPVRATAVRSTAKRSGRMIDTSTRAVKAPQQQPTLSNYRDDEDTTLRLSDLFADGGV